MRTAVSGYCYSSCSRMFLGGSARYFTDDYMPESNRRADQGGGQDEKAHHTSQ